MSPLNPAPLPPAGPAQTPPTPPNTVTLRVNGSHGPVFVNYGDSVVVTWTTVGVTLCTAVGSVNNGWAGNKLTSGSVTVHNLKSSQFFKLEGWNAGVNGPDAVDSVLVVVDAQPIQTFFTPTQKFLVAYNETPLEGQQTFTHEGHTTDPVPFNATALEVETALRVLPSVPSVTVTGDYTTGYEITIFNLTTITTLTHNLSEVYTTAVTGPSNVPTALSILGSDLHSWYRSDDFDPGNTNLLPAVTTFDSLALLPIFNGGGPDPTVTRKLYSSGYGFSVPAGARVNGVEFKIVRANSGIDPDATPILDSVVKLYWDGAERGTNLASDQNWPNIYTAKLYGGSTNKWGLTTELTNVTNPSFGWVVSIFAFNAGEIIQGYITYFEGRIFYSPPVTSTVTIERGEDGEATPTLAPTTCPVDSIRFLRNPTSIGHDTENSEGFLASVADPEDTPDDDTSYIEIANDGILSLLWNNIPQRHANQAYLYLRLKGTDTVGSADAINTYVINYGGTGVNQTQKLEVNATSGTYSLSSDGSTTTGLLYNANAASIQSALEVILGTGNVSVTGTVPNITITYQGDLEESRQPLITVNYGTLGTVTGSHGKVDFYSTDSSGTERQFAQYKLVIPTSYTNKTYAFTPPTDQVSVRVRISATDLDDTDSFLRLTSAAIAGCRSLDEDELTQELESLLRHLPSPPADDSADITFDPSEGDGLGLSPPTFSPPNDPQDEVLRPNRDIQVYLWNPKPAWAQINVPPLNPSDTLIVTPAEIDSYNSAGEFQGMLRPRLELGFTPPRTEGPWESVLVRFSAARSRPIINTGPVPELVDPTCQQESNYDCPGPVIVRPIGVDSYGSWLKWPHYLWVDERITNPDGCVIYCIDSSTHPIKLRFENPYENAGGYNKVTARIRARAVSAKEATDARKLERVNGNVVTISTDLVTMPEGGNDFEIRWEPFNCDGDVNAFATSDQEIVGAAVIRSNVSARVEFSIASGDSTIKTEVSLDGTSWNGVVIFDIGEQKQRVINYRVKINHEGVTTIGVHGLGIVLSVTGDDLVFGEEFITPPTSVPLSIEVLQGTVTQIPLVGRLRLKSQLTGNFDFDELQPRYTTALVEDWFLFSFSWEGLWSQDRIKDLRLAINSQLLDPVDEMTIVEVDVVDLIIENYCPGVSPLFTNPDRFINEVLMKPDSDIDVSEWLPAPAYTRLGSDPRYQSSEFVEVDPTVTNYLTLGLTDPDITDPPTGVERLWTKITVIIQASVKTDGGQQSQLTVQTNYHTPQDTPDLTSTDVPYTFEFTSNPGITTDQLKALKLGFCAKVNGLMDSEWPSKVRLKAVEVIATSEDVTIVESEGASPPPPPESPPSAAISITPTPRGGVEVFACGNLGTCGLTPSTLIATVHVENNLGVTGVLDISVTGNIEVHVENGLSLYVPANSSHDIPIYGQVGLEDNQYPLFREVGLIYATLKVSSTTVKTQVDWFYKGR
jgi:hypothetical protein